MAELTRKEALERLEDLMATGVDVGEGTRAELRRLVAGNSWDRADMVRAGNRLLAGPLRVASYKVRDPGTGEWSGWQFHMTYNNLVLGVMGEEAAKLFARMVCGQLGIPLGPLPGEAEIAALEHAREDVA